MKKFINFLLLSTILLIGLSSCSYSNYPTGAAYRTDTKVILTHDNFKVLGQAQGKATVTRILGIGGLSRRAINENAYALMVESANLQGSQAIVNVTYSTKVFGVPPFWVKSVVTAYGTIIEFTDEEAGPEK